MHVVLELLRWVGVGLGLGLAALTVNAFLPVRRSKWFVVPSFLLATVVAELAVFVLLAILGATGAMLWLGESATLPGQVTLALLGLSAVGMFLLVMQGRQAAADIGRALRGHVKMDPQHRLSWLRLLLPFPFRLSKDRVSRNIEFARVGGQQLRLDVYRPPVGTAASGRRRPAVVHVHGGGWVVGDKREQGIPLMTVLSDGGYVGFNVNYRLSPGATWPDHLIDVKRAIAWVREHADEYGVDPSFVALTGGSAGGHLVAMAALTQGDRTLQPGFEDADTSVQAVVPLYAIYDMTDECGTHVPGFVGSLLEPIVIKAFIDEQPERFADASPMTHISADAPPFFVIHGDRDSLAPLPDARRFVEALRAVSQQPVVFAELRGAHHSFDFFVSVRSLPVLEAVVAFFDHVATCHAPRS